MSVSRHPLRTERLVTSPAIIMLFAWMIVPLAMTLYFSTRYYNLLYPGKTSFVGLENFVYFFTYPSFMTSVVNTLLLVGSVLFITVVFPGQVNHRSDTERREFSKTSCIGLRATVVGVANLAEVIYMYGKRMIGCFSCEKRGGQTECNC